MPVAGAGKIIAWFHNQPIKGMEKNVLPLTFQRILDIGPREYRQRFSGRE